MIISLSLLSVIIFLFIVVSVILVLTVLYRQKCESANFYERSSLVMEMDNAFLKRLMPIQYTNFDKLNPWDLPKIKPGDILLTNMAGQEVALGEKRKKSIVLVTSVESADNTLGRTTGAVVFTMFSADPMQIGKESWIVFGSSHMAMWPEDGFVYKLETNFKNLLDIDDHKNCPAVSTLLKIR